jgi:hypothetical protein
MPSRWPSRSTRMLAVAAALLAASLAVSACQAPLHWAADQTSLRVAPDFGVAVRQDVAAQIADPDAQYKGVPGPATNGMRTAQSEHRYVTGTVKQPPLTITQQAVPQSSGSGAEGGTPSAPSGGVGGGPP